MKSKLRLSQITVDDRAQPRAALIPDRVAEYVEDMSRGDQFPPLIVFKDKENAHWLADGFHRYHAAVGIELKTIECDIRRGELRDAILYSCGANAAHGLRRTNADKRQAASKLLTDEQWAKWSDREIAKRCHVNHHLVAQLREQLKPLTGSSPSEPRTYRTKHGTTAKMKRGKRRGAKESDAQEPLPLQMQADMDNGWISSALWEIEKQIDRLPPPAETAARFPTHHHHTFTAAKLRAMADWLVAFAGAWPTIVKEHKHGEEKETVAA